VDVGGIEAKRIGDRFDDRGASVLQANTSLDVSFDRAHRHGHRAAICRCHPRTCHAVGDIEGRRDVDESAVGNTPSAHRHADGGEKAGASENSGRSRMPDRAHFQGAECLGKRMLEPVQIASHIVCSETEVFEGCEEGDTDLSWPVDDGPATAARKAQGNLAGGEVVVTQGHIGTRTLPTDRDGGVEFEDKECRISAT
jgi:hypothetical protein